MLVNEMLTDIQAKIKADLTVFGEKVYIMAAKESMPEGYHRPYVSIVYAGGNPDVNAKKEYGINWHFVDIYIFQAIWNEEFVVNGATPNTGENRGLTSLLNDMELLLRDFCLPTADSFYSVPTEYFPTENWILTNDQGKYDASIGLKMKYGVKYGIL
jgi:hypothetical protein